LRTAIIPYPVRVGRERDPVRSGTRKPEGID
jgi:hypothetical protein